MKVFPGFTYLLRYIGSYLLFPFVHVRGVRDIFYFVGLFSAPLNLGNNTSWISFFPVYSYGSHLNTCLKTYMLQHNNGIRQAVLLFAAKPKPEFSGSLAFPTTIIIVFSVDACASSSEYKTYIYDI